MSDTIVLSSKKKVNVILDSASLMHQNEKEKVEDIVKRISQSEYNRGKSEGETETRELLEKEFSDKLVEISEYYQSIISKLNDELENFNNSVPASIIDLAILISEKIIVRETELKPVLYKNFEPILKRLFGAGEIIVKVNPADKHLLQESFSNIKFEEDASIETGGCLALSEIGNIDARISSQIQEIRKSFETALFEE